MKLFIIWKDTVAFHFLLFLQHKNKRKVCCKNSKACKKIALEDWSLNETDSFKNVNLDKIKRHINGSKVNVLKKSMAETARQSVLRKTKIINRNVPDRLGKYLSSYSVRSETKLLLSDCKLKTKALSHDCSSKTNVMCSKERLKANKLFEEFNDTKQSLLGAECLPKNEAVCLENTLGSVLESKNIFENFFDNCLESTSKENDMSSQENLRLDKSDNSVNLESVSVKNNILIENLEALKRFKKADVICMQEKTPVKKKNKTSAPKTPAKIRDHSNYYSSHKSIRHVCAYCQKIFKSNGKLNSHVYSHTGERPFDCNHCGKAFSSKFKLVRHLLIHSEIRKFVCQICDRTFLRNDHLKNHYKVHDPQKKMYKCPKENCDKEYSSPMSHKKHMAYHNVEDGDLKCLICSVKYETKEEVLFHLKSHSGSRLFKTQSDKKFKCEFCERLFLTRKDVTRHLVVHTGERDFLCQFCPQRFGRKDHLVRHIKKSHENEELSIKHATKVNKCKELDKSSGIKDKTPKRSSKKLSKNSNIANNVKIESFLPPNIPLADGAIKENNVQKKECLNKTHVVITVQDKSSNTTCQNQRKKDNENEKTTNLFQKNEALVLTKKKVPPSKGNKNSTTQILLENIPNIFIIPNNSIILLRNQSSSNRKLKTEKEVQSGAASEVGPSFTTSANEGKDIKKGRLDPTEQTVSSDASDNVNLSLDYEATTLHSSCQFLEGFSDEDALYNVQSDFVSHFLETEQHNFEMISQNDLLPRSDVSLNSLFTNHNIISQSDDESGTNMLTERYHQIKLLDIEENATFSEKPGKKNEYCEEIDKELITDGNLMLSESILNDIKEESSFFLSTENNVGILNNILNQPNDSYGFELLRNILTTENPCLSPLPGFNQIFHNSNTNSN